MLFCHHNFWVHKSDMPGHCPLTECFLWQLFYGYMSSNLRYENVMEPFLEKYLVHSSPFLDVIIHKHIEIFEST